MRQGPELNLSSPQSRRADAILQLFINSLLPQTDSIERVKRHYKLFRATVERPGNPLLLRRRIGSAQPQRPCEGHREPLPIKAWTV